MNKQERIRELEKGVVKMNRQDPELIAIIKRLKKIARTFPWIPLDVPAQRHYHVFPDGLSICFTLDIVPRFKFWHLSIFRALGDFTPEEIEFLPRAFFDEPPAIQFASQINGLQNMHFYWKSNYVNEFRKSPENS